MGTKNFGTLAAQVTANASNFDATLSESEKKLQRFHDFADRLNKKKAASAEKEEFTGALPVQAKDVFSALQESASAASPKVSSLISTVSQFGSVLGPVGIAVAAVSAEFALMGYAVEKTVSFLVSTWQEMAPLIVHTGQLAKVLGASTESLVGFHLAAEEVGVSGEVMDTSMERMQRKLGEAKSKGGEAAAAFKNLGYSTQEIADLASGPGDAAMQSLIQHLHDVHDHSLRATEGEEVFGRQFREMAPIVEGGAAALEEATRKAEEMGVAFSSIDAAQITAASVQTHDLEERWKGVKTQLAIGISPYIAVIVGDMNEFLAATTDTKTAVGELVETAGEGLAELADAFQTAAHAAEYLYHMTLAAKDAGMLDFSGAADEKAKAANAIQQPIDAGDNLRQQIRDFRNQVKDGMQDETGGATDMLGDPELEYELTRLSDLGHNIWQSYDLASNKLQEFFDDGKISASKFDEQLLKMQTTFEKSKAAMAKGIWDKTATPMEKYKEQISELDQLLEEGKIGPKTYGRAKGQDTLDILKTDSQQQIQSPRALEAGTGEAYSAILKATRPELSIQERMARVQEQSERHLAILAQIAQASQQGGKPKTEIKGA